MTSKVQPLPTPKGFSHSATDWDAKLNPCQVGLPRLVPKSVESENTQPSVRAGPGPSLGGLGVVSEALLQGLRGQAAVEG